MAASSPARALGSRDLYAGGVERSAPAASPAASPAEQPRPVLGQLLAPGLAASGALLLAAGAGQAVLSRTPAGAAIGEPLLSLGYGAGALGATGAVWIALWRASGCGDAPAAPRMVTLLPACVLAGAGVGAGPVLAGSPWPLAAAVGLLVALVGSRLGAGGRAAALLVAAGAAEAGIRAGTWLLQGDWLAYTVWRQALPLVSGLGLAATLAAVGPRGGWQPGCGLRALLAVAALLGGAWLTSRADRRTYPPGWARGLVEDVAAPWAEAALPALLPRRWTVAGWLERDPAALPARGLPGTCFVWTAGRGAVALEPHPRPQAAPPLPIESVRLVPDDPPVSEQERIRSDATASSSLTWSRSGTADWLGPDPWQIAWHETHGWSRAVERGFSWELAGDSRIDLAATLLAPDGTRFHVSVVCRVTRPAPVAPPIERFLALLRR